jgi:hypothetical protein
VRLKGIVQVLSAVLVLTGAVEVFAQDLDSELELNPRTRWVLESGVDPSILDCRVSDRGHIQCVSNTNLLNVECEAMHYGRLSQAKAIYKGRAFSCEGTRYDKDSLLSQWRVRLKAEKGTEAVWLVDAADKDQLRRLYMTELKTLETLPRAQRLYFSFGLLGRFENLGAQSHQAGALKLELGQNPVLFEADFMQLLGSKVEDKNRVRIGLGVVLNADDAGRGWLLRANTGHSVLPLEGGSFAKAWSHCIGPEYRWNPSSWAFRAGAGNCWFQKAKISFAPQAHLGIARRISGVFYLTGELNAGLPIGEYSDQSISGPQIQAQLGVLMTLLPD